MMLVVVTQELEKETFLINELNEIAPHFTKIIVITTQKNKNISHNFETIVSNKFDYIIPCIFYSIIKIFSKETVVEIFDRSKFRIKPSVFSMIYNLILARMIDKRLKIYLNKIWIGEELILYSYWLNVNAYFVANYKKQNPQITAISRAHGFEIRDFDTYIPFRKTIDSNLDKIIFISDYTKMEYELLMKKIANSKRAEQRVIRLGVNSFQKCPFRISREKGALNIVSCSGIYSLKRIDLIIDSLAEIPTEINVNWMHFGSGSDFEVISEYARRKLTKSNISFVFKGKVSNKEILKYYDANQVDLFINTSDYEGIPVSMMEAMSCGIPCIARDIGGISEIITNNISGFLLPKDASPSLIANTIQDFYLLITTDNETRIALRNSTYNYWKDNYNAKNNYSDFVNYIFNYKIKNV